MADQLEVASTASAARPAEVIWKRTGARLDAGDVWVRLSFYNIGLDWNSKKTRHTDECLASEIFAMVYDKDLHLVGISEVYNLQAVQQDKVQRREEIMRCILSKLNTDGSAARPAIWEGRSDGHYILVWKSSRLDLAVYEYVSCGTDQNWRKAQYFRFRGSPPQHVCH